MNLASEPREDFVTVDRNLTPEGKEMEDLLRPGKKFKVVSAGGSDGRERHAIRIPLGGHEMAMTKLLP
jgi:hypothetical protein